MTDLLDTGQVDDIRRAFNDLADTFAFPISIIRTTYTRGAFATAPTTQSFSLKAIRQYGSGTSEDDDQLRNTMGPDASGEFDLFIGWKMLEDAGLIDADNRALIDHNDLVEMEGEIHEILTFGGVADMTKRPTFLQLRVKRRFANPNGAATP